MKSLLSTLILSTLFLFSNAQAPDFTLTDIYGVEHSLYEDYLDQGIPVVLNISVAWGPWDWEQFQNGAFQDLQTDFGDDLQVLWIEADPETPVEALYGNTNDTQGDFVTGTTYPIFNTDSWDIVNSYGVIGFPATVLICEDGSITGPSQVADSTAFDYVVNDSIHLYTFEDAELIALTLGEFCGITFERTLLNGYVYSDEDDDCEPSSVEQGIQNFIAYIQRGTDSWFRTTNADGDFRILLNDGDYTVDIIPANPLWTSCEPTQSFTVDGVGELDLDFGMEPAVYCPYGVIDISTWGLRRCFENCIFVNYCNYGTEVLEDAQVVVELTEFMEFTTANPSPTGVDGQTYTFNVGDLGINECGTVYFNFELSCDAELGDTLCYSANILPDSLCIGTAGSDALAIECQEVIGSWDPNDKMGFPAGEGELNYIKPNTDIKYQIRFQNTGTDTAFTVIILDTLPEDLEFSTIRMGAYSHDFEWERNGQELKFVFNDIMLPDSNVNNLASNGFVNFHIAQKADLPDGHRIENSAAIFFDFNEPVITNTAFYTVWRNLVSVKNIELTDFLISPNPAEDLLTIQLTDQFSGLKSGELVDITGRVISEFGFIGSNHQLNLRMVSPGIYFVNIRDDEGNRGVEKVVVR